MGRRPLTKGVAKSLYQKKPYIYMGRDKTAATIIRNNFSKIEYSYGNTFKGGVDVGFIGDSTTERVFVKSMADTFPRQTTRRLRQKFNVAPGGPGLMPSCVIGTTDTSDPVEVTTFPALVTANAYVAGTDGWTFGSSASSQANGRKGAFGTATNADTMKIRQMWDGTNARSEHKMTRVTEIGVCLYNSPVAGGSQYWLDKLNAGTGGDAFVAVAGAAAKISVTGTSGTDQRMNYYDVDITGTLDPLVLNGMQLAIHTTGQVAGFGGFVGYYNDYKCGIRGHNLGFSGGTSLTFSNSTVLNSMNWLTRTAPSDTTTWGVGRCGLIFLSLQINDARVSTALATWKSQMTTIITTLRARPSLPAICLFVPNPPGDGGGSQATYDANWLAMWNTAKELVDENAGVFMVCSNAWLGYSPEQNAVSVIRAYREGAYMMNSDLLHPEINGVSLHAECAASAIFDIYNGMQHSFIA